MKKKQKVTKKNISKASGKRTSIINLIFFGFLIVILPFIHYKNAMDRSLMPQLLAVSFFLLGYSLFILLQFKNSYFKKRIFKEPVIILIIFYLIIVVVSSFFSVNYKESFFDIVKTFIFCAILLVALKQLNDGNKGIDILPNFFLVAGFLLLFVGYYQYFTKVLPYDGELLADGRSVVYLVNGMMAHKNLYSSALFMMLPFQAWGFWKRKGRKRAMFGLVILLTLIMILLLSTRAVWLGSLVAGFSMLVVLTISSKNFNLPRRFRFYTVAFLFVALASGFVFISSKQSVSGYSVGDRFRSIFDPEASNNRYRLNVWEASLDLWQDNPVIGVGAGNWKLIAPEYFGDLDFNKQQLNWFRPHNDFLWILTEKGAIGLIIFLALIFSAFLYLFRIIRFSDKTEHKVLALLLCGGLAGYFTISFFDFPLERIYHQNILAIWLAAIVFLKRKLSGKSNENEDNLNWLPAVLVLLLLSSVIYSYSALKFETEVKKVQVVKNNKNWEQMYNLAGNISTRFRNVDPDGMPVHYYHGVAKEKLKEYDAAKAFYIQALEEHPAKVQILNNLGLMYYMTNDFEKAELYLSMALNILPNYFEALVNLSAVYSKTGNYRKSLKYLRKIPKSRWDERFYMKEEQLKRIINSESSQQKTN